MHLSYMKINKLSPQTMILILIILLGSFVRIFQLSTVPPHLTPDEAALGYNAYSILKTGRDEHGVVMPVIFKSFGDNKPGLYVYLTVPFIQIFGLNEFSTRFASALAGIISIFLIYKITQLLFSQNHRWLPLISAAILSLSPWHIQFSRGAWEVNVALTLTLAGILFFLKALQKNIYLPVSAAFFALTLLTYQGAKLSTTIVVLLLVVSYFKQFLQIDKRKIAVSVVVGVLICVPIVLSVFNGQASRLTVFSVFSSPRPEKYLSDFLSEGGEVVGSPVYYLFHSEPLNFARGIMGRWFNHFSGRFLFFEGDWQNFQHSAPYVGMLNLLDLPLLIAGLYTLIHTKNRQAARFVFLWLILACMPAILSRDQVHAVRSLNMVIPLVLVSTLGAGYFIQKLRLKRIAFACGGALYLLGFVYYADAYFVHLPKLYSQYWEYGYKQAVQAILPIQNKYETIIFQQSYSQPYIYFLFFGKYDPATFQTHSADHFIESKYGDVGQIDKLDNIVFTGIDWQVLRGKTGTIVVGDAERIPSGDSKEGTEFHIVSEIPYLNNKSTALRIIEIK